MIVINRSQQVHLFDVIKYPEESYHLLNRTQVRNEAVVERATDFSLISLIRWFVFAPARSQRDFLC